MIEDPSADFCALDLLLVVRYVERIADQATNISEEVVNVVEAAPNRHAKFAGGK